MKKTIYVFAALVAAIALPSHGASVNMGFSPSTTDVNGLGQNFSVDIVGTYNADAAEGAIGGALDLSYDETIINVSAVTLKVPTDFAGNNGAINNGLGRVDTMGFATFASAVVGNFVFATVDFTSVGFGSSPIQVADSNDLVLAWANEDFNAVSVLSTDGVVNVVPIPAPLILFLSALMGLGTFIRKTKT